ncbi:MAG: MATE family efflux transporter [Opitutales bacterium]
MAQLKREAWDTFKLAVPMIIGQVSVHLTQVIDAAMIGRVGVNELAAAAFASNFYMLFLMTGFGLTVALSVYIAGAFGQKNEEEQRDYLAAGILSTTAFGLLMAAAMHWALPITEHMGQPSLVIMHAQSYLILLGWSTAPVLIIAGLKGACESINKPWFPLPYTLGVLPLNAFLNWIMIYGNLGCPAMGLDGAGIATVLSRAIMIIWLWHDLGKRGFFGKPFGLLELFRRGALKTWSLLKMGITTGLQITFEVASFNGSAIMMGWIGAAALAAHQIAIQIVGTVFMVPLALSFAISIRVGQALGSNKPQQAKDIGLANAIVAATLMVVAAVGIWVFRENLIGLFIGKDVADAETVIAAGIIFLTIAAIFQIGDGLNIILMGYLRGYRDVRIPTISAFIVFWCIGLTLAFFLAFGGDVASPTMPEFFKPLAQHAAGMGGTGIWIALAIALWLSSAAMGIRAVIITRREGKKGSFA